MNLIFYRQSRNINKRRGKKIQEGGLGQNPLRKKEEKQRETENKKK